MYCKYTHTHKPVHTHTKKEQEQEREYLPKERKSKSPASRSCPVSFLGRNVVLRTNNATTVKAAKAG